MNELIVFVRGREEPVVFRRWPKDFVPQGKGFYCHNGSWYRFHKHKSMNGPLQPIEVPKRLRAWALMLS